MLKQHGVSLLEVLAAIFVISIGLIGVLAVIPFGAYQVSKANHAEFASNMLANAAEEIYIREIAKPTDWGFNRPVTTQEDLTVNDQQPGPHVTPPTETSPGTGIFETITHTITNVDTSSSLLVRNTLIESFGLPVLAWIEERVVVTIDCETVTETVDTNTDPPTTTTSTVPHNHTETRSRYFYALNCTRFIWFEPRENNVPLQNLEHIFPLWSFNPAVPERRNLVRRWEEPMRGQDDILYTTYRHQRPDFAGQNGSIVSSGKYTWLFTFLPQPFDSWDGNCLLSYIIPCGCGSQAVTVSARYHIGYDLVPLDQVNPFCTADILACYNRVSEDDDIIQMPNNLFSPSSSGGTFAIPNLTADQIRRLTETKYVFVTWDTPQRWGSQSPIAGGAWCKIVFLDKDEHSMSASPPRPQTPKIVVTGDLPGIGNSRIQMYIPNGVLYHKRVEGVPIR